MTVKQDPSRPRAHHPNFGTYFLFAAATGDPSMRSMYQTMMDDLYISMAAPEEADSLNSPETDGK